VRFQWGGFYRDVGNTTLISKGFQCVRPNVGHLDKTRMGTGPTFKFCVGLPLCRRDKGQDLAPFKGRQSRENSGSQELYRSVVT
jgi:hypothetical protein